METMYWEGGQLFLLDQTKLPHIIEYCRCRTYQEVASAIKKLVVRGAPAIGVAAAYGMALAARACLEKSDDLPSARASLLLASRELAATRPTAVNLFWALERVSQVIDKASGCEQLFDLILQEAHLICREDIAINQAIGEWGKSLIPREAGILTHCNAGALATAGYGTALGVIRSAHREGKKLRVFADETRPLLQGARLTVFELMEEKIPVTLITDNMAGYVMKKGLVDLVIVGADRITARGDTANKIGTYSLAVLAKEHGIPFYVAAPASTFDLSILSGEEIPIEERSPREVREFMGIPVACAQVEVYNPAFDVTPHHLIRAIITEKGLIFDPTEEKVRKLMGGNS